MQKNLQLKYNFFSDNLCLTIPVPEEINDEYYEKFIIIINVISLYQFILMDNGILVRGGLSEGLHFSNNIIIFSEGLVKSYDIESKIAIYPRIVIDNDM